MHEWVFGDDAAFFQIVLDTYFMRVAVLHISFSASRFEDAAQQSFSSRDEAVKKNGATASEIIAQGRLVLALKPLDGDPYAQGKGYIGGLMCRRPFWSIATVQEWVCAAIRPFSELVWTLVVVRVAVLHTTVDRIRYSADCRRYCSSHQGQSEYDLASTTEYTK